eukprot:10892719-Alexandrium_andersonii.AAC.1
MSGGAPEAPPGLEGREPGPERSRSARAAPATSSSPITSTPSGPITPSATPTALGPSGAAGVYRRAPGGQAQQPTPANPESARVDECASAEA